MALRPRRLTTGVGLGTPQIPYDQSGLQEDANMPPLQFPPPVQNNGTGADSPPADLLSGLGQDGGGMMGLGGNGDMMGTDAIPTDQLEGLDSQAPEDLEAQQMVEALQDPSTPPEVRAAIEADLQMAARRKMAGGGL